MFVGLELKQNREIAFATAKDVTTEGFRELNFARMNADWYWAIAEKLNAHIDDPGRLQLGIPVANTESWREALKQLSAEEYSRFQSFHLQEMNEARRLLELAELGIIPQEEVPGIPDPRFGRRYGMPCFFSKMRSEFEQRIQ